MTESTKAKKAEKATASDDPAVTNDETKSTSSTKAKDSGRKSDAAVALDRAVNAEVGDDGMPKHDERDLAILKDSRAVTPPANVEVDPPEAEQNHADWFEGREPNDVVEVAGQRETVEARMARNGQASAEKAAGATTLSHG